MVKAKQLLTINFAITAITYIRRHRNKLRILSPENSSLQINIPVLDQFPKYKFKGKC